jgi:small nuclear ribonucleoprotein G
MVRPTQPELKKFLGKRLSLRLNGSRVVSGRLAGFDIFMNVVLDEAAEERGGGERTEIGVMVRCLYVCGYASVRVGGCAAGCGLQSGSGRLGAGAGGSRGRCAPFREGRGRMRRCLAVHCSVCF